MLNDCFKQLKQIQNTHITVYVINVSTKHPHGRKSNRYCETFKILVMKKTIQS